MHFSLPPTVSTTSSSPQLSEKWAPKGASPASSRAGYFTHLLKRRRRVLYLLIIGIFFTLAYLRWNEDGYTPRRVAVAKGAIPPVVLIVALDKNSLSSAYSKRILENRKRYAEKWGYEVFAGDLGDYEAGNEYQFKDGAGKLRHYSKTFNKLPIIREAMSTYPYTKTFWFLSSDSLIINMDLDLETHILSKKRLGNLMLRNHAVIPPESIIKTFKRQNPNDIQLIITQDTKSVRSDSFIIRRQKDEMGWGKKKHKGGKKGATMFGYYLLDLWFDPLYRFYHFKEGETSALEHLIQWHPTVLAKLAIIPQRVMLSYPVAAGGNSPANKKKGDKDAKPKNEGEEIRAKYAGTGFESGDFVVHFEKCGDVDKNKACMKEFERYWKMTEKYKKPEKKAGKAKGKPVA
ncbi:hypothetical protein AOL_s00081g241 [Orbilia oligospora ATCC 24927]|uniref:Alpha-1,6-mannosyltransferase n=1 Tax=Arthrobotrys oligospora (strain ATCC 24927 / CBS 115.81 / DSM 1491) TaxID=756982 RepID=G1XFU8_ARTOA|nr:hypothetical protein AOL_s00081g241 [Orbilia oligospora ATCC 24927]EGX47914.1 hypothetical protein AOL_s00081g241 [Orbilia oligospora ATCC 24927]